MPIFRFDKVIGMARGAKAFLRTHLKDQTASPATAHPQRREARAGRQKEAWRLAREQRKEARQRAREQRQQITVKKRNAKRELARANRELNAAKVEEARTDGAERRRDARRKRLELIRLKSELRTAKGEATESGAKLGALPDFVLIGPGRSGTSFFFRLLGQHPYVELARKKEIHFFDLLFDEGVDWYRWWFPAPVLKDGRWTITGEATPVYIFNPRVPERMARVVPQVRLITLLRNPVDRTYSAYNHKVRTRRESRSFEEVIETELADKSVGLLWKGVYVDHLVHWSKFLDKGQLLVLKSEELFARPRESLKRALDFLDLPDWEPEDWDSPKQKRYERIDPSIKRRLEEYFEPHNRRLYDFLGMDLGW